MNGEAIYGTRIWRVQTDVVFPPTTGYLYAPNSTTVYGVSIGIREEKKREEKKKPWKRSLKLKKTRDPSKKLRLLLSFSLTACFLWTMLKVTCYLLIYSKRQKRKLLLFFLFLFLFSRCSRSERSDASEKNGFHHFIKNIKYIKVHNNINTNISDLKISRHKYTKNFKINIVYRVIYSLTNQRKNL